MSLQDPIADFITVINNAQKSNFKEVFLPHSKIKENISAILHKTGYIGDVEVVGEGSAKKLKITLKYYNRLPVIQEFKRISKLSRRKYVTTDELPVVKNGLGEAILTTNKGLMTAKEAKALNVGGEVLCTIF